MAKHDKAQDIGFGILIVFVLNIIAFIVQISWIASLIEGAGVPLVGLIEWLYVVPLAIYFWKRRPGIAQGALIMAAGTFLLNAACYGLMFG